MNFPVNQYRINYFLASSTFCHLLITFANSFDPDQDQQNVRIIERFAKVISKWQKLPLACKELIDSRDED